MDLAPGGPVTPHKASLSHSDIKPGPPLLMWEELRLLLHQHTADGRQRTGDNLSCPVNNILLPIVIAFNAFNAPVVSSWTNWF